MQVYCFSVCFAKAVGGPLRPRGANITAFSFFSSRNLPHPMKTINTLPRDIFYEQQVSLNNYACSVTDFFSDLRQVGNRFDSPEFGSLALQLLVNTCAVYSDLYQFHKKFKTKLIEIPEEEIISWESALYTLLVTQLQSCVRFAIEKPYKKSPQLFEGITTKKIAEEVSAYTTTFHVRGSNFNVLKLCSLYYLAG